MKKLKLHPSLKHFEFTLDDIIFPPLKIPDFEWENVNLTSQLTKRITLKTPLISAPMDTVTGHKMAILMALLGGIGVIHYNFPTIQDQMREVEKVRKFEAGFIKEPVIVCKNATIGDVLEMAEKYGFYSFPITEDGTLNTRMVGFVTRRDVRYREDLSTNIQKVMTSAKNLITAHCGVTLNCNDIQAANKIIKANNLDTLPIVDDDFKVVALVTDSDLSKNQKYPMATKDSNKQLKVLVAVESRLETAKERIMAAKEMGVSGIVVDARNIFDDHLKIARWVKKRAPELDVILGNVVSARVVYLVMKEIGSCIDAFRVGIGGGEVCITTEALGIGRPLGAALYDMDQALKPYKKKYGTIGIIADGGIKSPHHIVGALMLGAQAVMMGSELAGLDESPVEMEYNSEKGRMIKYVRGMGSSEVIRERAGGSRYGIDKNSLTNRFAEGIKKLIPYKGSGEKNIEILFTGVRQAMHGLGHKNLKELYRDGYIIPARQAVSKGTL